MRLKFFVCFVIICLKELGSFIHNYALQVAKINKKSNLYSSFLSISYQHSYKYLKIIVKENVKKSVNNFLFSILRVFGELFPNLRGYQCL